MVTLIDREFTVNVTQERAWDYLVRLDLWPTWAPHIKYIATVPQTELSPDSSGVIHLASRLLLEIIGVAMNVILNGTSPWHLPSLERSLLRLRRPSWLRGKALPCRQAFKRMFGAKPLVRPLAISP